MRERRGRREGGGGGKERGDTGKEGWGDKEEKKDGEGERKKRMTTLEAGGERHSQFKVLHDPLELPG